MDPRRTFNGSCEIPAKTVHYFSDGTGRDVYIAHNSGGMIAAKEVKTAFELGNLE